MQVGIVGTERNQMVAIANTIRELIEIRKFATGQEEVLSIEYDKSKFAGNHVTDEERKKHRFGGLARNLTKKATDTSPSRPCCSNTQHR